MDIINGIFGFIRGFLGWILIIILTTNAATAYFAAQWGMQYIMEHPQYVQKYQSNHKIKIKE